MSLFKTEPLSNRVKKSDFDCTVPPLNEYIRKYAGQNEKRHESRTFVSVDKKDRRVTGYYSLVASSIKDSAITAGVGYRLRKLSHNPFKPVILLGRLAVDYRYSGKGLGSELLLDAFKRFYLVAKQIGCIGMIVDSKDGAKSFYEKNHFLPFDQINPNRLLLTTNEITLLLEEYCKEISDLSKAF